MKKRNCIFVFSVIIIIFITLSLYKFNGKQADTVYIYKDSRIYKTVPLNENCEIDVGDTNIVVIEDGQVYMKWADCPDKLCIRQGKIKNSSKSIICLPNRVEVKVDKKSDIDVISK